MNQVHALRKKKLRDAREILPGSGKSIAVEMSAPLTRFQAALHGVSAATNKYADAMRRGAFRLTPGPIQLVQTMTMTRGNDPYRRRYGETKADFNRRLATMPPFSFPKGPKPGPARIRDNTSVNRAAWLRKENRRRHRAGDPDNGIRGFRSKHGLVQALIGGAWKTI